MRRTTQIFERVARGELTPEAGAKLLLPNEQAERSLWPEILVAGLLLAWVLWWVWR